MGRTAKRHGDGVPAGNPGKIIAGLIRVSGSFDLAEEAMQDAFTVALARWPAQGAPGQSRRLDYRRRSSQVD